MSIKNHLESIQKPQKGLVAMTNKLLEKFGENYNISKDDDSYDLFKQIISNSIADVAGVKSVGGSKESPKTQLKKIYEGLEAKYGEEKAESMIFENLRGHTQTYVNTPHPTEFFSAESIVALITFMKKLKESDNLFNRDGKPSNFFDDNGTKELMESMKIMFDDIKKPLGKSMTIPEEMYRGTWLSKRQAEAIPLVVEDTLDAIGGGKNSSQLSFEQLERYFGSIQRSGTWTPGDQDSKPDATVDMLKTGLGINKRAVYARYFRSLAEIGARLDTEQDHEAIAAIENSMYRLAQSTAESFKLEGKEIPITEDNIYGILLGKPLDGVNNPYQSDTEDKYKQLSNTAFFRNFANDIDEEKLKDFTPYNDFKGFTEDLKTLREKPVISSIKEDGKRLSKIDNLIVTVFNTKDSAQRIQVRQNALMHNKVLDYLKSELADEYKSLNSEQLTDVLMTDQEFANLLKEKITSKIATIEEKCGGNGNVVKDKIGKGDKNISQAEFDFYQTMSTMGVAVENADRVPRYIIAECSSKEDMMNAFFLIKTMEKVKEVPEGKRKLEVVSLVEHPNLVTEKGDERRIAAVDMNVEALQNKYFREHHTAGDSGFDNLKDDYSLEEQVRKMTVADAKRKFGYKVLEGDENKKIEGVKMFMGAGSDVTKAGGSAAAAAMQDAIEKSREALLDQGIYMIDYLGTGGGLSRSNPSSNSISTVQGRTVVRTDPITYAYKTMALQVRNLRAKLVNNGEEYNQENVSDFPLAKTITSSDRVIMARSNLGNMYDLPKNSEIYEDLTKPRTDAMIEKYNQLYTSEEFSNLVSYSANPFVTLTQYAARPLKRVTSAGGSEAQFPPEAKVDGMRAIGFAAALNASGCLAPTFYGGDEYLKETEEGQLKKMYLYDPKAQDTINRMTYGIVMADMENAWKYVGCEEIPDYAKLKGFIAYQGDDPAMNAKACLAKIQIEHDKVAQKLLKLHYQMIGKENQVPNVASTDVGAEILKTLPTALREQLTADRENIKASREKLSTLFNDIKDGKEVSLEYITRGKAITDEELNFFKTKNSDELTLENGKIEELAKEMKVLLHKEDDEVTIDKLKDRIVGFADEAEGKLTINLSKIERGKEVFAKTIYPSMGTVAYECFEHTPLAFSNPQYARAVEKSENKARAA